MNLLESVPQAADVDLYSGDLKFPGYPDGENLEDVDWTAGHLRDCLGVITERGDTTPAELRKAPIDIAAHRLRFAKKKVSRYETCIERSLYRGLHELQRLQASRSGDKAPHPPVLDVNVSQNGS